MLGFSLDTLLRRIDIPAVLAVPTLTPHLCAKFSCFCSRSEFYDDGLVLGCRLNKLGGCKTSYQATMASQRDHTTSSTCNLHLVKERHNISPITWMPHTRHTQRKISGSLGRTRVPKL